MTSRNSLTGGEPFALRLRLALCSFFKYNRTQYEYKTIF